MRLLLVEDNDRVAEFVGNGLDHAGFTVDRVARLEDASAALGAGKFGAIVLDLGLPDGDGGDWLKARRAAGNQVPVLMLTARASTGDKVKGLNLGADDYLAKPFEMAELVARIKALLRRPDQRRPRPSRPGICCGWFGASWARAMPVLPTSCVRRAPFSGICGTSSAGIRVAISATTPPAGP